MENRLFKSFLLGGTVSLCTIASPAFAQDLSDEEAANNENRGNVIVVTAQKREQNPDDIGMSITAIGGDALEEMGISDTADLSALVPGFTFSDTGFTVPVYTIRGVGFAEQSVQATATVGIYNDQVAVPFPIMSAGLQLDVQRVEVLKGPQGTLYGRNATAGAVNYIANRPGNDLEIEVNADYSSFDTFDVGGVISAPLFDGVGVRIAARHVTSGRGWQESVTRDETIGRQDRFAARALVDMELSDQLSVDLAFNYWTDQSETQVPQFWRSDNQRPTRATLVHFLDDSAFARIPLLGTDDAQAADWTTGNNRLNRPEADMEYHSFAGTLRYELTDDIRFTSLTSYSEFKNNSSYDNSGWAGIPLNETFNGISVQDTIAPIVRGIYDQFDTVGSVGYTNQAVIEAFSQELRLDGNISDINWLVGFYYSSDNVDSNTPQLVELNTSTNLGHLFGIGLQGVENPTMQEGENWAVFSQVEFPLSDSLNLTAGLRYSDDNKEYAGCTSDNGDGDLVQFTNAFTGTTLQPGDCAIFLGTMVLSDPFESELSEDSVSWRLALDYDLSPDTLLYASYSRGFKSGSFPTLTTNRAESLFPVTQERLDAFELGLKNSLDDGNLQLNFAAFYYDYKDKQLFTKVLSDIAGPANSLANVPQSEVYGAEFDMRWYATDNLFLSLGATWLHSEVKEFTGGYSQLGIEGDFAGSPFPYTPELQANAMVNYEFDISSDLLGFINVSAQYSAESSSDYAIAEVLDNGANGSRYLTLLGRYGLSVGDSSAVRDEFILPDYMEVDLRFGVRSADERWSVSAWVRNLTDEYIVNNSRKSSDAVLAWTARPRTVGVSLGYSY